MLEPAVQFFRELGSVTVYIVTAQMLKKKAVRWVVGFGLFPLTRMHARAELGLEFLDHHVSLRAHIRLVLGRVLSRHPASHGPCLEPGGLVVDHGRPDRHAVAAGIRTHGGEADALEKGPGKPQDPRPLRRLYALGVGLPEEFVKILPFFLFALSRSQKVEARSGLFWGLSCGFGFAIAEAVMQYNKIHASEFFKSSVRIADFARSIDPRDTTSEATLREALFQASPGTLARQITRFISLPLLHAAWSGINGWFIASASNSERSILPAVLVGLILTSLLHGAYDTFCDSSSIGLLIAAVSLLLFLAYMSKALDQSAEQGDAPGDV